MKFHRVGAELFSGWFTAGGMGAKCYLKKKIQSMHAYSKPTRVTYKKNKKNASKPLCIRTKQLCIYYVDLFNYHKYGEHEHEISILFKSINTVVTFC